jgi:cytochrome c5
MQKTMRFSSGLGLGFIGVSACVLLAPWTTVSAKTRAASATSAVLRPEFRSMLSVPQEQAPATPKKVDVGLPDGEGKDVVLKHCTVCHTIDNFSHQRHDKDRWAQIMDDMISKGMDASEADSNTILNYLSTNLGPATPAADSAAPKPSTPNK